jgi:hypothetical protein
VGVLELAALTSQDSLAGRDLYPAMPQEAQLSAPANQV